jgi:hypothetical protein
VTEPTQPAGAADQTAPISVSFTTSVAEQVAVARAIHRSTRNWQVMMFLFAAAPIVLAVRKGWSEGMSVEVALLGLAAALGLVWWNYGIAWIAVRAARRGVRNPDGPFTWVIDEGGCRVEGPAIALSLQWPAIADTKETPDFFLLYVTQTIAHFIPKRAVPETAMAALRRLLERGKAKR